jgi:TRAP-type C4-dicarboxylate transport system substrate-binding protein
VVVRFSSSLVALSVLGSLSLTSSSGLAHPRAREHGGHGPHHPKPPPPIVLRVATPFAAGHILADTAAEFERVLEARTRGRIDVQVATGVLNEQTINPAMQACEASERVADVLITGGQPLQDYAPAYFFFNGPYVIEDYAHFSRVYEGELGDEARALIAQNSNLVAFGTVYRGFRQFTSNSPIESPDDFVGLRLRLPPVPDWVAVWTSLGVTAVQIPLTGIYDALATGVADASEGDLTQISSLALYEVQSHLSLTSHLVGFGMILANECFLDGLSRRDARRVRRALDDAADWGTEQMTTREAALLDSLAAAGMTVVTPDAAAIREAARPAIDNLFETVWTVTTWDEVLAQ